MAVAVAVAAGPLVTQSRHHDFASLPFGEQAVLVSRPSHVRTLQVGCFWDGDEDEAEDEAKAERRRRIAFSSIVPSMPAAAETTSLIP